MCVWDKTLCGVPDPRPPTWQRKRPAAMARSGQPDDAAAEAGSCEPLAVLWAGTAVESCGQGFPTALSRRPKKTRGLSLHEVVLLSM